MSKNYIIVLTFRAILQSWSDTSLGKEIRTRAFPTKSAVTGLIASAFGIPRGDKRIEEISREYQYAVRVDKRGMSVFDFQTSSDYGFRLKANREIENRTMLYNKEYLSDAAFSVFLNFEDSETAEKCLSAIQDPANILYLGRKCCLPSCPIVLDNKVYATSKRLEDFLAEYPTDFNNDAFQYVEYYIENINGEIQTSGIPYFDGNEKKYRVVYMEHNFIGINKEEINVCK